MTKVAIMAPSFPNAEAIPSPPARSGKEYIRLGNSNVERCGPAIQRQFKQQEARQKNIGGGMPYVSHPRHRQSGSTQHKAPELGFYQVVAPDNAQSQNEPKHNKKIDIKGEA